MSRTPRNRSRDVLAPLAYVAGVAVPCCIAFAYLFRDRPALAVVVALTVVTASGMFVYFRRAAH